MTDKTLGGLDKYTLEKAAEMAVKVAREHDAVAAQCATNGAKEESLWRALGARDVALRLRSDADKA